MKHLLIVLLLLGCMAGGYSCKSGPSKEELAAQEQARIDSIKKATEDSIRLADSIAKVKADSIAKAKADSIANSYGVFDINGNPKDGMYTLTGTGTGCEPGYTFPVTIKLKVKNGFAQIISMDGAKLSYPPKKFKGKTLEYLYREEGTDFADGISITAKDKLGTKWSGGTYDTCGEDFNLKLER